MEAAIAIATLVAALALCAAGITAVSLQLRCVDAAREAVRLAARGDGAAVDIGAKVAPAGASVEVRREGQYLMARVTARSPMLPGLDIAGEAVSLAEPGV